MQNSQSESENPHEIEADSSSSRQLDHNEFNDFAIRDVNIEFVNYCLEESPVNFLYEEIQNTLGAQQNDILRMIIWQSLLLFGVTRVVRNLLYQVSPVDPSHLLW